MFSRLPRAVGSASVPAGDRAGLIGSPRTYLITTSPGCRSIRLVVGLIQAPAQFRCRWLVTNSSMSASAQLFQIVHADGHSSVASDILVSGSSRVGIQIRFQAHPDWNQAHFRLVLYWTILVNS